jgi:hypothetical protein
VPLRAWARAFDTRSGSADEADVDLALDEAPLFARAQLRELLIEGGFVSFGGVEEGRKIEGLAGREIETRVQPPRDGGQHRESDLDVMGAGFENLAPDAKNRPIAFDRPVPRSPEPRSIP